VIESAFVLCGGLGTRLRGAIADVPKVLAPVGDRTFLDLLVKSLDRCGARRIVLLTGYLADQVERYVSNVLRAEYSHIRFELSPEPSPLGTAGALQHARRFVDEAFLLINGDTHLDLDLNALVAEHRSAGAAVTIAAVSTPDAERFGSLEIAANGEVRRFVEKGRTGPGLVNAGAYVIEPRVLAWIPANGTVSLERTTLPEMVAAGERVHAATLPGSFLDIGTVESWTAFSSAVAAREGSRGA
jgi:NDP-sugar pyrophosphorylase family protein